MRLRMRTAKPGDMAEVAALHLASWRDAYRGILADEFLDGALAPLLARRWEERLSPPQRAMAVVLAALGGEAAGFVAILRRGATAHVDSLHVRPGLRGAGVGRALLGFAARRMRHRGCTAAEFEVLAANQGAIRFSATLGALIGPEEPGAAFGQAVAIRRCTWPDIGTLIAAADGPAR